jgi:hypothetical protein
LQKWFGGRLPIPGLKELAIVVQDAEIQASGVQIEATLKRVLLGGEAHGVSSACFDG